VWIDSTSSIVVRTSTVWPEAEREGAGRVMVRPLDGVVGFASVADMIVVLRGWLTD
jgi:hypothetical protein